MKDKLFKRAAFLGLFIFTVNLLAMKFFWYYSIWWFDMPMHFLGGIFIGLLSLSVYMSYFIKEETVLTLGKIFWIAFISALIVGVAWELFEFSLDTFITFKVHYLPDTLSDLCFDMTGAMTAALYYLYFGRKFNLNINFLL